MAPIIPVSFPYYMFNSVSQHSGMYNLPQKLEKQLVFDFYNKVYRKPLEKSKFGPARSHDLHHNRRDYSPKKGSAQRVGEFVGTVLSPFILLAPIYLSAPENYKNLHDFGLVSLMASPMLFIGTGVGCYLGGQIGKVLASRKN